MLSRFLRLSIAGTLAAALFSSPAFSQGKGHGKGKGHNKNEDDQGESSKYYFGERDREIITRYYSNRGWNLPPGLEKHLERNGTLPPGLQKRIEPCPMELERQLPPLPADYHRAVLGAHVLIVNKNTNVIVDIMKNVVR